MHRLPKFILRPIERLEFAIAWARAFHSGSSVAISSDAARVAGVI